MLSEFRNCLFLYTTWHEELQEAKWRPVAVTSLITGPAHHDQHVLNVVLCAKKDSHMGKSNRTQTSMIT